MRQYFTKAILFSSVMVLSACGSLSDMTSGRGVTAPSVAKAPKALGMDLAALEQKAMGLKTFEYRYNQNQYVAYLSSQPELIKAQEAEGSSQFFYKAGKLVAALDQSGVYQFGADGKVANAFNAQGNPQSVNTDNATKISAKASKLYKMFSYNKADNTAANMKTGNDAKLNYLCIAKIQQVAQTQRVFRSPENAVLTANSLNATVRLNGTQFYKMDCQIAANKVTKLSLMKK
ncbi:hypothetical protein [Pasteurella sp. PK-2025]|uniref:hypothetical protein n=1 Tax=unclassified Pasteurella TaxID=2621516 RepID=UPI003C763DC7